jgi:cytochrome c oxidase subunit 1
MVGSTLFAFLGGMYHWWGKMFGKSYHENWARTAAVVVFIGFNTTFFVQFIAGSRGMPRRYATYDVKYEKFHQISTVGAWIMGVGMLSVAANLAHSLIYGKKVAGNQWGGNSLEWYSASPPRHDNFEVQPEGGDPHDYDAWKWEPSINGYIKNPDYVPQEAHH